MIIILKCFNYAADRCLTGIELLLLNINDMIVPLEWILSLQYFNGTTRCRGISVTVGCRAVSVKSPPGYKPIPADVWVWATDSVGKSRTQDGESCTVEIKSPSVGLAGRSVRLSIGAPLILVTALSWCTTTLLAICKQLFPLCIGRDADCQCSPSSLCIEGSLPLPFISIRL